MAGSRESSLGCGTSGGLRAGTECTREVCLGLLDLVGRDVLLAMALGRLTCALEAVAVELSSSNHRGIWFDFKQI